MLKENKRYFSRRYALFLTVLILATSFYAIFALLTAQKFPVVKLILYLVKITFALSLISSRLTSEAKCSWIFFALVLPYAAIPVYFVFCKKKIGKKERKILKDIYTKAPRTEPFNSKMILKCNDKFAFLREIANFSTSSVYKNTSAKYINEASKMIEMLSHDIKQAKQFIFLEFYTIAAGRIFGNICDLLIEKAENGIEVRILYDELGSLGRVPDDLSRLMKNHGIEAIPYASLPSCFPGAINNRNHRKIAVIDGEVAYTGGINLADEYIWPKAKLGKWKDSAVRIEGEGVSALTYTFLSDFSIASGTLEDFSGYYKYRKRICEGETLIFNDGPSPLYKEKTSERIILSMLGAAEKHFTVTTPYLVCNEENISAVRAAVRRGVKVRIIIPSKPDKFFAWILTRHYATLLSEIGAEVYVYAPGFMHSKTYSADGKYLMCGSVNLDYRSLCHNFETGILFSHHPVISEAESDIEEILRCSIPYKKKREFLPARLLGAVMELLSPLF